MAHKISLKQYRSRRYVAAIAAALFLIAGIYTRQYSSAATSDSPYGQADYCALENGETVIYGWASDPGATSLLLPFVNITVNSLTVAVPTDKADYRDKFINAYISKNHPGDPKPGTYGFRAAYSGLHRGNDYYISGTAVNVGSGTDAPLQIGKTAVDGDASKTPFDDADIVPDECLNPAPAAPPDAAGGTPASLPDADPYAGLEFVSDGGKSADVISEDDIIYDIDDAPSNNSPGTRTGDAAEESAAGTAEDNGSDVSAGTLSASIKVPADGAAKVHIAYGLNKARLGEVSKDKVTGGGDTVHDLSDLRAHTTYTYQIIRTMADGRVNASPSANFTTLGFDLAVFFITSDSHVPKGISGKIAGINKTGVSDNEGKIVFSDMPAGDFTISYEYRGTKHTDTVRADGSKAVGETGNNNKPILLSTYVHVDKISARNSGHHATTVQSTAPVFGTIIGVMAAGMIFKHFVRRRMYRHSSALYAGTSASQAAFDDEPVMADPLVIHPDIVAPPTTAPAATAAPVQSIAEHLPLSMMPQPQAENPLPLPLITPPTAAPVAAQPATPIAEQRPQPVIITPDKPMPSQAPIIEEPRVVQINIKHDRYVSETPAAVPDPANDKVNTVNASGGTDVYHQ